MKILRVEVETLSEGLLILVPFSTLNWNGVEESDESDGQVENWVDQDLFEYCVLVEVKHL